MKHHFHTLNAAWRRPCIAALLALAAVAPAMAAEAQQKVLPNGLTVIVQPDHRAPTAVHMLWVRVGSMDEVDGTSGVAHVLEHMMFKGSATLKAGEFSRKVAALGGRENAFTSKDYTGYFQQIPVEKLEAVMQLEADRFATNQWSDEDFRKELEVVKEERRMRTEDNPHARLGELHNAAQFVAHPYRRPIVGWMGDLESLQPDDARSFWRTWYTPANAAVVVAGDVDPEKVFALAAQYYGGMPQRAVPERKPRPEPVQNGVRRVWLKASAEQAVVALSYKVPGLLPQDLLADTPSAEGTDALALMVLDAVLSGYDGARLERALTQDKGHVADGADSYYGTLSRGPATFGLTGIPAKGKTVEQVEAALRAQVTRVAKEGISQAELERVKAQWVAASVYQQDSVFNQGRMAGVNWATGYPLDSNERLIVRLRQVTAVQVQAVAAKYFGDDALTVATLIPQPLGAPRKPAAVAGMRH
ncbi:MAG: insulinase family protein [Rhodoferax sp.]|nr:MAG: insulinase family protein [Rhodoferax sp.]